MASMADSPKSTQSSGSGETGLQGKETHVPGSKVSKQLPVDEAGPDSLPGDQGIRNVPEGSENKGA
jgi:hypothetical protein